MNLRAGARKFAVFFSSSVGRTLTRRIRNRICVHENYACAIIHGKRYFSRFLEKCSQNGTVPGIVSRGESLQMVLASVLCSATVMQVRDENDVNMRVMKNSIFAPDASA